jgi:hypothetical protein
MIFIVAARRPGLIGFLSFVEKAMIISCLTKSPDFG